MKKPKEWVYYVFAAAISGVIFAIINAFVLPEGMKRVGPGALTVFIPQWIARKKLKHDLWAYEQNMRLMGKEELPPDEQEINRKQWIATGVFALFVAGLAIYAAVKGYF